jgi:hypothetical protein
MRLCPRPVVYLPADTPSATSRSVCSTKRRGKYVSIARMPTPLPRGAAADGASVHALRLLHGRARRACAAADTAAHPKRSLCPKPAESVGTADNAEAARLLRLIDVRSACMVSLSHGAHAIDAVELPTRSGLRIWCALTRVIASRAAVSACENMIQARPVEIFSPSRPLALSPSRPLALSPSRPSNFASEVNVLSRLPKEDVNSVLTSHRQRVTAT